VRVRRPDVEHDLRAMLVVSCVAPTVRHVSWSDSTPPRLHTWDPMS
jgi:hypothetical protein